MKIDSIKVELIDWIARLEDKEVLKKISEIKEEMSSENEKVASRIFGSGRHLVEYIAEDFNEPLDEFKEYQK